MTKEYNEALARLYDEFKSWDVSPEYTEKYLDKILFCNPFSRKKIAFTFDDGPNVLHTEKILDTFKKYGAKANFMIWGQHAEKYPDILKRTVAEGHLIGNHTYTHSNFREKGEADFIEEFERCSEVIYNITGVTPKYARTPGLFKNELIMDTVCGKLGLTMVNCSHTKSTGDWAKPPAEKVIDIILNGLRGGDVILCHDGVGEGSVTPYAVEYTLPRILDMGFEVVTLDELLADRIIEDEKDDE